ncbi:hypothetical protein ACX6XY_30305, partial [Streptomyces sp. O3]
AMLSELDFSPDSRIYMVVVMLSLQPDPLTARLVVAALLSHCREQLVGLEMRVSRSRDLFLAVQDYLEENLSLPLTRESVAKRFHITPNYL